MRWTFAVVLAMLTIAVPPTLWAQEEIPTEKLAEVLLEAVSHDRNLTQRSGGGIHIGVVHKGAAQAAAVEFSSVRSCSTYWKAKASTFSSSTLPPLRLSHPYNR